MSTLSVDLGPDVGRIGQKPDPRLLRGAVTVLQQGGLAQGMYENSKGEHCTVGAVLEAAHADRIQAIWPEIGLLAELLGAKDTRSLAGTIATWNDDPRRTAEDVIDLLEQAAEKVEADG